MADTTSSVVNASGITSERNSFTTNQYGSDAVKGILSNVSIPSVSDLISWRSVLPSSDKAYWLSDSGSSNSLSWQAYANTNNTTSSNDLRVSGELNGSQYDDTLVAKGPYAWSQNYNLNNYTASAGGSWDLDRATTVCLDEYRTSAQFINNGDTFYNNFNLKSSGVDAGGRPYASTTIRNMYLDGGNRIFAYVKNNRIVQAKPGDVIPAGTVCMYCFQFWQHQLVDPSNFAASSSSWIGFARASSTITVQGYIETRSVYGLSKFYAKDTPIIGSTLTAGSYGVRPSMDIDTSKIAFLRESTSGTSLTTVNTLTDGNPTSTACNGSTYKAVVKDTDTTISAALANAVTDKGAVTVSGSTVKVPWGATKITIPVTSTNANYLSALVDTANESTLYGEVAEAGSDSVTLDVTNLVNNKLAGSKAEVSLYSEQANAQGTSDTISSKPISFTLQVDYGTEHTLTYDAAGGTGATLPSAKTYKAGTTITSFDGSTLVNEGNTFSCWKAIWTNEDKTDHVAFIKAGEPFTIPDADVTLTALYGGIDIAKETSTDGTYTYTITFNTDGGVFTDGSTTKSQKLGMTDTISNPGNPKKSGWGFDGWKLTEGTGAENPIGSNPTGNAVYTAQWKEAYTITWDAGAGTFSDGSVTKTEQVTPGDKALGVGEPTRSDDWVFTGWKDTSGTTITPGTTVPADDATYTAQWEEVKGFWLAPAGASNPTQGIVQTNSQIKAAATDIASKGTSSTYYSTYRTYMTNDTYHLYTMLTDGTYLEARIVQVGPHDSDGSGLTFQAVHSLPMAYQMNTSDSNSGGWAQMSLRTSMNSGTIYNLFDTNFTSQLKSVTKVSAIGGASTSTTTTSDKLWIMSYSELTGQTTLEYKTQSEGSQYAYWIGKSASDDTALGRTRAGGGPSGIFSAGEWWERSTEPGGTTTFMNVRKGEGLTYYRIAYRALAVIPCFSF